MVPCKTCTLNLLFELLIWLKHFFCSFVNSTKFSLFLILKSKNKLSFNFSTGLPLNKMSFKAIPLGTILYLANQFKKSKVFFFNRGILIFFVTFLILKILSFFFSNSSQTTPIVFDLPNGTSTKSPSFKLSSLS